jgi:acyl transferase domain-containing protein
MLSLEIKPDMIIGCSIGEAAAVYASGAMSHEAVVQIAAAHGVALGMLDGRGAVAALDCSAERAVEIMTSAGLGTVDNTRLCTVDYHSPNAVVVAGNTPAVERVLIHANGPMSGTSGIRLKVSVAPHSAFVDPCRSKYTEDLEVYSRSTGDDVWLTLW